MSVEGNGELRNRVCGEKKGSVQDLGLVKYLESVRSEGMVDFQTGAPACLLRVSCHIQSRV